MKGHRRWSSKGHLYWQCCETFQHSHSHQLSEAPWLEERIQPLREEENRCSAPEVCSRLLVVGNCSQDEAGREGQA